MNGYEKGYYLYGVFVGAACMMVWNLLVDLYKALTYKPENTAYVKGLRKVMQKLIDSRDDWTVDMKAELSEWGFDVFNDHK